MTAIAAVHTPQGFAIAADGRRSWQYRATDISRQFESETVQKIFEIASDDVALAYFIRGDTVSEDGSWDIASQIREAVQSVNEAKCSTCLRFADALCAAVQGGIEKARSLRRLDGYPNTQICILGYFRGTASWIDAIFQPRLNQCGVHYHLFPRDCDGRIFLSGSQILDRMTVREDARIAVQLPF